MRESLLSILRCPRCLAERTLTMTARARDEREVREGTIVCSACDGTFEVSDGIVDLLWRTPAFVDREAAGLRRFADVMRADGWDRERILALPDVPLGYWVAQRHAIDHVLRSADFKPGERLVDVGSNTCWASNIFARAGLDVVALDIATAELQGLRTADYFLEMEVPRFGGQGLVEVDETVLGLSSLWLCVTRRVMHSFGRFSRAGASAREATVQAAAASAAS